MYICTTCKRKLLPYEEHIHNHHVISVSDYTFEIPKKTNNRAWKHLQTFDPEIKSDIQGISTNKDTYYDQICRKNRSWNEPLKYKYNEFSNGTSTRDPLQEFIQSPIIPPY
jgi:hypothetical protein